MDDNETNCSIFCYEKKLIFPCQTTRKCMRHMEVKLSVLPLKATCSQGEADNCLLLHVACAVQKGSKKVTIRTANTDVVVLAETDSDELWTA